MATLHPFEPRHRPHPGLEAPSAAFTRAELSQMLSVYSRRVADGEWRDYAIDSRDGVAIFSIFRRTFESPLFTIVKHAAGHSAEYELFSGPEHLDSNVSLPDLLATLDLRLRLIQS
jgi:hypothetical protein